jgi:glycosyltransferase involved in cell wall biosynthesis
VFRVILKDPKNQIKILRVLSAKTTPKVTVIVPAFNAELFISRCIKSIINQTLQELEIILINDGSTDKTQSIVNDLALTDNRIKVIHQQNAGPGKARNAGLDIARGEFVGFVDSDDFIDSDMFRVMFETARYHNADVVQCGFERLNNEGSSIGSFATENTIIIGEYNCVEQYSLQRSINNYLHCKLIRRAVIKTVRFPNLFFSEDAYFLIQAFVLCKKAVLIKDIFYKYIQHDKALTQSPFNVKKMDVIESGKAIHQYVNTRFPDLTCYWSMYIVLNSTKLYSASVRHSGFREQHKELINAFKYHYQMIQKTIAHNNISKKSRMALRIFRICPKCYAFLYNLFH